MFATEHRSTSDVDAGDVEDDGDGDGDGDEGEVAAPVADGIACLSLSDAAPDA